MLFDLLTEAQRRGLVGPGDLEREVAHARAFSSAWQELAAALEVSVAEVLDVGSGGGLPGLVLAVEHPSLAVTLLDARQRSVDFLTEAVAALDLVDRAQVLHGRAELLARDPRLRSHFDVATLRSVGPPAVAAELSAAFVRSGGVIAVSERPGGGIWDEEQLALLGCRLGPHVGNDDVSIQLLQRVGPVPPDVPRQNGIPAKRPRW